jgi:putative two-component system response regulator
MNESVAGARVLVVDDDQGVASFLKRLLIRDGYVVEIATDGDSALKTIATFSPDVILLDVVLPDVDGLALCKRLKSETATRLTPVILVTGLADQDKKVQGADVGADEFLTKPIDARELLARVRSLVRLKRYTDDLDSASSIIMALAMMIETRGGRTEGHCHRVANRAVAVGRRFGLGDDDLQALQRGGFLHDIGMLAIPEEMLSKTAALNPEEFEIVKSHTVVDLHDAATTKRPYQKPLSNLEAIAVLRRQVEQGWRRKDVVEHFAAVMQADGT